MDGIDDVLERLVQASERAKPSGVRLGVVKWYDDEKGYGFITPDGGGDDVFFHRSATHAKNGEIEKVFRDGQTVEFTIRNGDKGPRADDVKISFFIPSEEDEV